MTEKIKKKSQKKARKKSENKTRKSNAANTPAVHENRVAVIGCGNVGMAGEFALLQSELVREMVLIDADAKKAEGEAMDLQRRLPFRWSRRSKLPPEITGTQRRVRLSLDGGRGKLRQSQYLDANLCGAENFILIFSDLKAIKSATLPTENRVYDFAIQR